MGDSPELNEMEDMVALCQMNVANAKVKPLPPTLDKADVNSVKQAVVCSDASVLSASDCDTRVITETSKLDQLSSKSLKPSAANHWQSLLGCSAHASLDKQESSTLISVDPPSSGETATEPDGVASTIYNVFVFEWPPWFENGQRAAVETLRLSGILPSLPDVESSSFIENWLTKSHSFRCEVTRTCDVALELLQDDILFPLILRKLQKFSVAVDRGLRNAVRNLPAKGEDMMSGHFEDAVCFAPNTDLADFAVRDLRDLRLLLNKAFSTLLHNLGPQSNSNLTEENRQLLHWFQSNFDRVPTQLPTKVDRMNSFSSPAWRHVQFEYSAYLTIDSTLQSFCTNWMTCSLSFRRSYDRNLDTACLFDILLVVGTALSDLLGGKRDKRRVFRKWDADVEAMSTAKDLLSHASDNFLFNIPDSVKQFCVRDAVEMIQEILSNLASKDFSDSDTPKQEEVLGSVRRTLIVVEMLQDGEMDDALVMQLCDTLTNICRLAGRKKVRLEPVALHLVRTWPTYFEGGRLFKCSRETVPSGMHVPPHGVDFSEELINDWLTKSYTWRLKFFKLIEEFSRVDLTHLPQYSEACCLILARKLHAMSDILQRTAVRCARQSTPTRVSSRGIASLTNQLLQSTWAVFIRKDIADLTKLSQVTQLYVSQQLNQSKFLSFTQEIQSYLEKFSLYGVSDRFLIFKRVPRPIFLDPPWRFIVPKFSEHILGESEVGSNNYVWLTAWLNDANKFRKLYQHLSLTCSEDVIQVYKLLLNVVRAQYLAKRERGIIGLAVTAGRESLKLGAVVPENLLEFVQKDVEEIIYDVCYALEVLVTNLSEFDVVIDSPCIGTSVSLSEKLSKIDWVPHIARLRKLYAAELREIFIPPSKHIENLEHIVRDFDSVIVGDLILTTEAESSDALDSPREELKTPEAERSFEKDETLFPEGSKEYTKSGKPVAPIAPMQRAQISDQMTPSASPMTDLDTDLHLRDTASVYHFDWPEWCDANGRILDSSLAAHIVSTLQSIAEIAVNTGLESTSNYKVLYTWFIRVTQFRSEYREYANCILLILQSDFLNLRRTCLDILVGKLAKMLNSVNQSVAQCKLLLTHHSEVEESDIFSALSECVSTGYFDKCFQDFCNMKNELVAICSDLLRLVKDQNNKADEDLVQKLSENLRKAPDSILILRKEQKDFDPLTSPPWLICRPYLLAEHFVGPDSPIGLAVVSDSLLNTWMDASLLIRQDLAESLSFKSKTANEKQKVEFIVKQIKRLKHDFCNVIAQLEDAPLIEDCEAAPGDVLEAIYGSKDSLKKLCLLQPHSEIRHFCLDDLKHTTAIASKVLLGIVEKWHDCWTKSDVDLITQELDFNGNNLSELTPLVDYFAALKHAQDDIVPMVVDDVTELAPSAPDYISRAASQHDLKNALNESTTPPIVGSQPVTPDFTVSNQNIPMCSSVLATPTPPLIPFMPFSFGRQAAFPLPWYPSPHYTTAFEFPTAFPPAMVESKPPLPVGAPPIPPPPPTAPVAAVQEMSSKDVEKIPIPPGSILTANNRNAAVDSSISNKSPGHVLEGFLNLVEKYGTKTGTDTRRNFDTTPTKAIAPVKPRFADKDSVSDLVARLEQRVETAKRKAVLDRREPSVSKFLKVDPDSITRPGPSISPDEDQLENELQFLELELKEKCEKVTEEQEYFGQARRIFASGARLSELDDQVLEFKTKADGAQRKLSKWEDVRDKLNDLREDYFRLQANLDELEVQRVLRSSQLHKLTTKNVNLRAQRAIYRDLAISYEAKRSDHDEKHLLNVSAELHDQCERLRTEVKDWFKTGTEHKPLLLLVQWKLEDWLQLQRTFDVSFPRLRAYTEQLKLLREKCCSGISKFNT